MDQLAVILDDQCCAAGCGWAARPGSASDRAGARREARALLDRIAEPLRVAARADELVRSPAGHPSGVAGITVGINP